MTNNQAMVAIKRLRSGDLVIAVHPRSILTLCKQQLKHTILQYCVKPSLKIAMIIFQSVDMVTAHKVVPALMLTTIVGFSLTVLVATIPDRAVAFPELVVPTQGIAISYLGFHQDQALVAILETDSIEQWLLLPHQSTVHLHSSATLGEKGTIVVGVGSLNKFSNKVQSLSLGDTIQLIGENQGVYQYQVVETRVVDRQSLATVFTQTIPSLVLLTPSSLTQSKVFAVIAR